MLNFNPISTPSHTARQVSPHVFTLPGWQGSGALHWQSRWEEVFGDERIEQHDWHQPLRGDWITRLEDVVQNQLAKQPSQAIVFAAHSLGCHLVAAWASLSSNTGKVAGALLVAPPSQDALMSTPQMHSWSKPVLNKLPFKTTLVASTRDPFCKFPDAQALATHWGSELINAGPIGHINSESGLKDWPAGRELLDQLTTR
jgi:uncharacterized protein